MVNHFFLSNHFIDRNIYIKFIKTEISSHLQASLDFRKMLILASKLALMVCKLMFFLHDLSCHTIESVFDKNQTSGKTAVCSSSKFNVTMSCKQWFGAALLTTCLIQLFTSSVLKLQLSRAWAQSSLSPEVH